MERLDSNGTVHSNSNSAFRRFTFRGKKEKIQAPRNITHLSIQDFRSPTTEFEASSARSLSPGSIDPPVEEDSLQQLQKIIIKLRSSPKKSVDDAFDVYAHHARASIELCTTLLRKPQSDGRNGSHIENLADISLSQTRSSSESQSNETRSRLVREYLVYQEGLLEHIRSSLYKTYETYEPHASKSKIEALFNDRPFRNLEIQRMRIVSMNRIRSDPPLIWDQYKIRFRNYEKLKKDIADIKRLFQMPSVDQNSAGTSDIRIAENGDTILEFNSDGPARPVLRFRVSSHMLCEVSPLFAVMLRSTNRPDFVLAPARNTDEILEDCEIPPPPTTEILWDSSSVKVYRMPQIELNKHNSMTTLLQAAHLHHDQVPREISFPEFVSIAEVCLKYRCTSPVEERVECRWLPKWVVKAADEMPDAGLLLICYVFGIQKLFVRISKSVILNMKDEEDLASNLPHKVRHKIIAIRNAKLKQLQKCCMNSMEEYLGTQRGPSVGSLPFAFVPRCPTGDHSCDAQNLGWLMLVFKELGILPSIMRSDNIDAELPRGSLKDLMNKLRLVTSAPAKEGHGEACDFAPAFRNLVDDVYNTVTGLTLKSISGREGCSLSRSSNITPQDASLGLGATVGVRGTVHKAHHPKRHNLIMDPDITLRILSHLENFNDLRSVAMTKKSFYEVYKSNKVSLMTGLLLKAERRATIPRSYEDIPTSREPLPEEMDATPSQNHGLDTAGSPNQNGSKNPPTSDDIDSAHSSLSQVNPYFQTPTIISEEEMERILWPDVPSTPPTSDLPFRGSLESRFSISTSSSRSDSRSSGMNECETRNEKYRLESKDDLKQIMQVEDKYLREEGDRRIGIGV